MGTVTDSYQPRSHCIYILGFVTFHKRMKQLLIAVLVLVPLAACSGEDDQERSAKSLSVFNVVTFPNSACGATNGYNGTCYTSSECSSLGGTTSGTCASSFGVCCVFSIACGGTSSANNSYAVISSYSTSTDSDPCTYTFCPTNTDVCKLRIDFDTMVLTAPATVTAASAAVSITVGDCIYDTLTVSNPGGAVPPTICGYNTGQHMFVPASSQCNQINIDIDTLTTTTTRKWQIKVTQYECGNMMAPEQDCLQYLTASSGTIASFNWDTSTSSEASSPPHLSSQYYDICIRRARSYCSVCYSPYIHSTTAASSFGLSATGPGPALASSQGSLCTGITTLNPAVASNSGFGDYLDIVALQPGTGTTGTLNTNRICGTVFNAASPTAVHATACSWAVPFKVGVHFDQDEAIAAPPAPAYNLAENDITGTTGHSAGAGYGYSGFYLNYWQNTC